MELYQTKPNTPWLSFLILIGFTLLFTFVSQIIVVLLLYINGSPEAPLLGSTGGALWFGKTPQSVLYVMLAVSSIGTFFLPAIGLQAVEKKQFRYFPTGYPGQTIFFAFALLFLIAFNPFMGLVSEWNMDMKLPSGLASLENWMRTQEDQMAELTKNMVMTTSFSRLVTNILVIAILPAIAEEYFFRGALQSIIQRGVKNEHVAIWVTAIVFSAIHIQFFGFFPRLLLGAMFGYMFVLTKNIWVPIFAHFVNNASVTIIAFYFSMQNKTYEDLINSTSYHYIFYLVSFVASIVIGYFFYKISITRRREYGAELG